MKNFVALVGVAILSAVLAGCAAVHSPQTAERPATIALALRVAGGQSPTPQQVTLVHNALAPQIERAGYRFADEPGAAELLLNVNLVPDPIDPSKGSFTVGELQRNGSRSGERAGVTDSEEVQALRRHNREIERWIELQSRTRYGEGPL